MPTFDKFVILGDIKGMRSRAKFTPRRTYGNQKSTYIRESQNAIRNDKQNPGTRMNPGVAGDKLRQAAGAEGDGGSIRLIVKDFEELE